MANKIITYRKSADNVKNALGYLDINMNSTQSYNSRLNQNNEEVQGPKKFKVDKLANINAVQNSLHNIFSWEQGERILLPEFGTRLRVLLYNGITQFNTEQIIAEIRRAVSTWEPRVQIDDIVNVGSEDDTDDNTIHLEIIYTISDLPDQRFNYSLRYNNL